MNSYRYLLLFTYLVAGAAGCALIAGPEEAADQRSPGRQLRVEYRETLRNQASLGGESLREPSYGAPAGASLQQPTGVYADQFRVYVTDRLPSPRVVIFDRGERSMTVISGPTPSVIPPMQFMDPSAVAVDEVNNIYVADPPQGKVFGMDRKGSPRLVIGATGELSFPAALTVDRRRGRLYIVDKHAHVVRVYTGVGGRLFELSDMGKEPGLRSPVGIALDRAGNSYTLDSGPTRVIVHGPDGRFLRSFPVKNKAAGGKIRPRGIAVDSRGHIYVTDGLNSMVLIFGQDGAFLQSWGRTGSAMHDDFWNPAGIFIDEQDKIYIADQMNGRIQVYQYYP